MNHYYRFVRGFAQLIKSAERLAPPRVLRRQRAKPPANAPKALIFSPHPDDECIVGALPLRLVREAKWCVINIAVTLGSNRRRRTARLRELKNACAHLGFDLLDGVELPVTKSTTRGDNPKGRLKAVQTITRILEQTRPRVIFVPHEYDVHKTHLRTHHLIMSALKTMPINFQCYVVETEYWGQMTTPNLLAEVSPNDLGILVAALSCHVGELRRNPYHLRLPAWMIDNVRRAELVRGPETTIPHFMFATVYRVRKWRQRRLYNVLKHGKFLSAKDNPRLLFP